MVAIKYNVKGDKRKSLAKALSAATGDPMNYLGVPSCNYQVGDYLIDKSGTITTDQSLSNDDIDLLVAMLDESGFHPITVESDGEIEAAAEQANEVTDETTIEATNDSIDEPTNGSADEVVTETPKDQVTTEEPETLIVDEPITEPETEPIAESTENYAAEIPSPEYSSSEDSPAEIAAPEESVGSMADVATSEEIELAEPVVDDAQPAETSVDETITEITDEANTESKDEITETISPETEDTAVAESTEESVSQPAPSMELGSLLSFSFPADVLDAGGWSRFEALKLSKYSLLKKSLKVDDLPTIREGHKITFPWCVYDGNPNRITATVQLIEAMIMMAKNAKYISSEEKPLDNEKFIMRIFMVRLNMKGEKYKIARKILMENLSGNSAWKTGKPPVKDGKGTDGAPSAELALNCQITANKPASSPMTPTPDPAQNNSGENLYEQA